MFPIRIRVNLIPLAVQAGFPDAATAVCGPPGREVFLRRGTGNRAVMSFFSPDRGQFEVLV